MRVGKPSLTARLVANARSISSRLRTAAVDPQDDLTFQLLSRPERVLVDAVAASERATTLVSRAMLGATLGLVDHVALRTAAIDAVLRRHVARGPTQLVILGAGLDLRAYRLGCLLDSHVFEVDFPATQQDKRRRTAHLQPRAQALTHVAVDFNHDDLGQMLDAAGHDPNARSLWIWEGVVPYLPDAAVDSTLALIGARSAPGSELVLSYITREVWWRPLSRWSVDHVLRAMGEPLGIDPSRKEMAERLAAAGLHVLDDSDTLDWYREHGTGSGPRVLIAYERLALAGRA